MCPASSPPSPLLLPAALPLLLLHLQASLGGQTVQKDLIVQKASFGSASARPPALRQPQESAAGTSPHWSPCLLQGIFNGEVRRNGGDFRGLRMEKQKGLVAPTQTSQGLCQAALGPSDQPMLTQDEAGFPWKWYPMTWHNFGDDRAAPQAWRWLVLVDLCK